MLNYASDLERVPIIHEDQKDIDILFLGVIDGTRKELYQHLVQKFPHINIVFKCGVWDGERDLLIARSKIVLNLHRHASALFEWVRVSYLLTNHAFVITEESTDDGDYRSWLDGGIIISSYVNLPQTIQKYLNSPTERRQVSERGHTIVSIEMPHAEIPTLLFPPANYCGYIDFTSYLILNGDVYRHVRQMIGSTMSPEIARRTYHEKALRHYLDHGRKESRAFMLRGSSNPLSILEDFMFTESHNYYDTTVLESLKTILSSPVPKDNMLHICRFNPCNSSLPKPNETTSSIILHGVEGEDDDTMCRLVVDRQWAKNFRKSDPVLVETLTQLGIRKITFEDPKYAQWITANSRNFEIDDHSINTQSLVITGWFK
jgi:hypothetical protein